MGQLVIFYGGLEVQNTSIYSKPKHCFDPNYNKRKKYFQKKLYIFRNQNIKKREQKKHFGKQIETFEKRPDKKMYVHVSFMSNNIRLE